MKLQLCLLETNETLGFEFPEDCTLHDLQLQIDGSSPPSSVHFSLNRKDELLVPSSQATLRSLGVVSGDLIYYSLDPSAFTPPDQDSPTQAPVTEGPLPTDLAGGKRLAETLFLRKTLSEESGDTSELTTIVTSVHAVMLESGFSLLDHDPTMRFKFWDEMFPISLRYTIPALISDNEPRNGVESVCVKFQKLGHVVLAYGSLGAGGSVRKLRFDKRFYMRVVDSLMETLVSGKEDSLSIHRAAFTCWRTIKDGLVTPLLIDLCYRTGLELPHCFMRLPRDLKRKILESLPGEGIAAMACLSLELRELASDNDLWKKKFLKKFGDFDVEGGDAVVNWKKRFAEHRMMFV